MTIDSQGEVNNFAYPSSLPAVGDGMNLLPNPVALSAGYISSESPAAPMPPGCDVTSMPDAGNPTVENVTLTPLAQDLGASTMDGLTQLEAPNCKMAQHTVANVTNDASVGDATTFPPRKDVRALEPAALQHGNVSGDFSDDMKNNDVENNSIPAPISLQENEPMQHQVAPSWNQGDISLPSIPSIIDEPSKSSDMSYDVSAEQATQPNDESSNRNLPALLPAGGEDFVAKKAEKDLEFGQAKDNTVQPKFAYAESVAESEENSKGLDDIRINAPAADEIDRLQSDVVMGETDEPSINLPSQPSSSLQRDRNGAGGNEYRSPKGPESVRRAKDDKSGRDKQPRNTTVKGKGVINAPPNGAQRVNNAEKSTSNGLGERSDTTSTTAREQTVKCSYVIRHLAHIPLNFDHRQRQPDLNQVPFDPNIFRRAMLNSAITIRYINSCRIISFTGLKHLDG